ncbi:MAG: helix-turn-helix domain-containing protein [Candidatus Latescibacteria bacterium]|nr:helix-turn-helix domain-containing protein [Candidatus Latescibacterota bacterium]
MNHRTKDFLSIREKLGESLRLAGDRALVAEGDSLSLIRRLPSHSVSLILTDPPYHSTKKHSIYGDTSFNEDSDYLAWIREYAHEWRRVLRPNGSFFCFCASDLAARLEVLFAAEFNVLSHVVWTKPNDPGFDGWKGKMKKEALRQWYPHSERIIFAEPAVDGNLHRSPFAHFLREIRKQSGLSAHALAEAIGAYGKVNHGGAVSNWETGRNIPSRDQYSKICKAVLGTGRVVSMPSYEDAVRVFRASPAGEFTDIWTFPSVRPYKGKHPAEKPAALLEHAIDATSFPGDIVLDCFAGSGSTALAAVKLGRLAVAMEIDAKWAKTIADRVGLVSNSEPISVGANSRSHLKDNARRPKRPHLPLFEAGK